MCRDFSLETGQQRAGFSTNACIPTSDIAVFFGRLYITIDILCLIGPHVVPQPQPMAMVESGRILAVGLADIDLVLLHLQDVEAESCRLQGL
jgi:hypothetical protein